MFWVFKNNILEPTGTIQFIFFNSWRLLDIGLLKLDVLSMIKI
jgi:hypothetical protein